MRLSWLSFFILHKICTETAVLAAFTTPSHNTQIPTRIQPNLTLKLKLKLKHPSSVLHASGRSDADGNYDPSAPATLSEASEAQAANEILLSQAENQTIDLPNEISNSFLQYSLSIILGRALPDARDGLKPVHRRILYAMAGLNLHSNQSHRKCARVVGEVLGKYHPHGDTAVYDALVRLAQPFATGTPLIDGHGNFGSIDNDPAAAMRYTECRLTPISSETLLDELSLDTVDFISNFDGNENEPTVLPAKVPILLLNGCAGIAVGMATNVPPHNLGELMDACMALSQLRFSSEHKNSRDEVTDKELFQLVPGPDFPTGATLLGKNDSKKMYQTGHGGVTIRAVTNFEQKKPKGRMSIIVTELPYQVNKSALLEKIADLVNEKKIEGIADLRDESDRDGVRVVIELKRDAVPDVVLNNLYKKTALQTTFSGNFLALMGSGTKPERFTLRSSLDCFLDFRFETIRRKSSFQSKKVKARSEVVKGLLLALESVDEVIDIIRTAPDTATARELLSEKLNLTPPQTDAVLKLQLGQLTRLNKDKLLDEKITLDKSIAELERLLTIDDAVWEEMNAEFEHLKGKYGIPRRTKIEGDDSGQGELSDLDLITNSRSVIVVTNGGYIKRLPLQTFSNQRRGTRGKQATSKAMDNSNNVSHCFTCNDHDTLLITTYRGIAFGLRAYQIPTASRTARGVPIPSVLPFKADDVIASILPVSEFTDNEYCVLATEQGWIKKTPLNAFENLTSRGLIIASLEDGDRLRWFAKCTDDNDIIIGSRLGMATRFHAAKLRPTGRTSRGVKSMKLREGDSVANMSVLSQENDDSERYLLVITKNGYGKRVPIEEFRSQARGGVGVIATKFKKASSEDIASCLHVVKEDDEVLLTTEQGVIVRQNVKDIPSQGRAATGVRVQKIDEDGGDGISSVSIVSKIDDKDDQ